MPKSEPDTAVPSTVAQLTLAAAAVPPRRVTVRVTVAVASETVAVAALSCSVLSSSVMVTVVEVGAPREAPTGPERVTVKVRAVLTAALSMIGTLIVLGAMSPSAQLSVPLVVV